jgi:hypothetical protein
LEVSIFLPIFVLSLRRDDAPKGIGRYTPTWGLFFSPKNKFHKLFGNVNSFTYLCGYMLKVGKNMWITLWITNPLKIWLCQFFYLPLPLHFINLNSITMRF